MICSTICAGSGTCPSCDDDSCWTLNLFLSVFALVNNPSRRFVSVAPTLCNNADTEGPDTIDTDNNREPISS